MDRIEVKAEKRASLNKKKKPDKKLQAYEKPMIQEQGKVAFMAAACGNWSVWYCSC